MTLMEHLFLWSIVLPIVWYVMHWLVQRAYNRGVADGQDEAIRKINIDLVEKFPKTPNPQQPYYVPPEGSETPPGRVE